MNIEPNICMHCGGTGIDYDYTIAPECCGQVDRWGGCCNNPIPTRIQIPISCEYCQGQGSINLLTIKQKEETKNDTRRNN